MVPRTLQEIRDGGENAVGLLLVGVRVNTAEKSSKALPRQVAARAGDDDLLPFLELFAVDKANVDAIVGALDTFQHAFQIDDALALLAVHFKLERPVQHLHQGVGRHDGSPSEEPAIHLADPPFVDVEVAHIPEHEGHGFSGESLRFSQVRVGLHHGGNAGSFGVRGQLEEVGALPLPPHEQAHVRRRGAEEVASQVFLDNGVPETLRAIQRKADV